MTQAQNFIENRNRIDAYLLSLVVATRVLVCELVRPLVAQGRFSMVDIPAESRGDLRTVDDIAQTMDPSALLAILMRCLSDTGPGLEIEGVSFALVDKVRRIRNDHAHGRGNYSDLEYVKESLVAIDTLWANLVNAGEKMALPGATTLEGRREDEQTQRFFRAYSQDRISAAIAAARQGLDPAAFDQNGLSPLQLAIRRNHPALVAGVVEGGADPNGAFRDGDTPLGLAVRLDRVEALKALLTAGANPQIQHPLPTRPGATRAANALHLAATLGQAKALRALLSDGVDLNDWDHSGNTLLHTAILRSNVPVARGNVPVVRELIEAGADVNLATRMGLTPLEEAKQQGDKAIVDVLIDAGADEKDEYGSTIRTAQELQDRRSFRRRLTWTIVIAVSLIVAIFAFVGVRNFLMIWAVEGGNAGLARIAIAAGADTSAITDSRDSGVSLLTNAAAEGSASMVRTLLQSGVNVHSQDFRGTALHHATYSGQSSIVRQLIDGGASVHTRNNHGSTPMHMIGLDWHRAVTPPTYQEIVEMLVSARADVNARDHYGSTPLHSTLSASHRPALAPMLLNAGANVNARDNRESTPLHVMMKHLNVYWPGRPNSIPAEVGYETVDLLIQAGADVNARDIDGNTPLHKVFDNRYEGQRSEIIQTVVSKLIASGANINAANDSGQTPLDIANEMGWANLDVVRNAVK